MTAMISSTVGGRLGIARPCCAAVGRGGSQAWSPASVGGRRRPAAGVPCAVLLRVGLLDKLLLYCHCEYMSTVKEERLQIRVDPADKALLERAAAASRLNVSAFVVQAAAAKAEEILAERSSIRLSHEAAVAFSQALEGPAEVNDRLAQALRRKRKFSWVD